MPEGPGRDVSVEFRSALGIAILSLIIGTGFYLLGFFSPSWAKHPQSGFDFSEGLWELCIARSDGNIPGSWRYC